MPSNVKLYKFYNYLFWHYILLKISATEIAKKNGISHGTIYNWLAKFNIPQRTLLESKNTPTVKRNLLKSSKEIWTRPGYRESRSGKNHHNYGKHLSKKTKQKIIEARNGYKHSEETKRKISEGQKGKVLSEETKKKIGEANKGRHHTEETKRKISASLRCRYHTDDNINNEEDYLKDLEKELKEPIKECPVDIIESKKKPIKTIKKPLKPKSDIIIHNIQYKINEPINKLFDMLTETYVNIDDHIPKYFLNYLKDHNYITIGSIIGDYIKDNEILNIQNQKNNIENLFKTLINEHIKTDILSLENNSRIFYKVNGVAS